MGSSSSTSRGNSSSSSTYPASRNRRGHSSAPPTQTLGDLARAQQRQSPSRLSYTRGNNHAASAPLPRVPPTTRSSFNTNAPTYNGRGRDTRPSTSTASSATAGGATAAISGSGNSAVQTNTLSRPGAYSISREGAGPTQVFRVQIPSEVRPGQEFQVSDSCVLKWCKVWLKQIAISK